MFENSEEVREYFSERIKDPLEVESRVEIAEQLLDGDLLILPEDEPETLSEEDVNNLYSVEYIVERFGPVTLHDVNDTLRGRYRHRNKKPEFFKAESSEGTKGSSFTPGTTRGILHSPKEYEERILEAYFSENDLRLGPNSKHGESASVVKVVSKEMSEGNYINWLKYRDPVGWRAFYENGDFSLGEYVKTDANNPEDLGERLGTSLHFAKDIFEFYN